MTFEKIAYSLVSRSHDVWCVGYHKTNGDTPHIKNINGENVNINQPAQANQELINTQLPMYLEYVEAVKHHQDKPTNF